MKVLNLLRCAVFFLSAARFFDGYHAKYRF